MPGGWELEAASTPSVDFGVCVPISRPPDGWEWALGWKKLQIPGSHYFYIQYGRPIHYARRGLVRQALAGGCRWIFFMDADMRVPEWALQRLLIWRYPVVSGLYISKQGTLNLYRRNPDGGEKAPFRPLTRVEGASVWADAVGLGCCLIDARVFKYLPEPWFDWKERDDGGIDASEDLWFGLQLAKAGFRILVDNQVRCDHYTNARWDAQTLELQQEWFNPPS